MKNREGFGLLQFTSDATDIYQLVSILIRAQRPGGQAPAIPLSKCFNVNLVSKCTGLGSAVNAHCIMPIE